MASSISNNWQNVKLKPLTPEQAASPHYKIKGGQNLPAAAIPSDRYLYGEPREKHTLRNHVLGAALLAVVGYPLARLGKGMKTEGAGRTKKLLQIHSKAYVECVHNLGSLIKTQAGKLKNVIIKPKAVKEAGEKAAT